MQSPGHSFAESTTSRNSVSGTGVVAPGDWSSSSPALFTYASPSMSRLEDLRGVLDTDPVPGAEVLVDPDLQRLADLGDAFGGGLLLHDHLSCRFLRRVVQYGVSRASPDGC